MLHSALKHLEKPSLSYCRIAGQLLDKCTQTVTQAQLFYYWMEQWAGQDWNLF